MALRPALERTRSTRSLLTAPLLGLTLVVHGVMGLALAGCGAKAPGEAEKTAADAATPIAVKVVRVQLRAMPRLLTLTGNVIADRQSEIAANVAGRITSAPIERGQRVKQGQAIVVVDASAAVLSAEASKANAELARTQAAQGREDCARAERLRKEGVITQADFERQTTQCRATQLQAEAARAQAGLATKLESDTTIRAPFAGAIGERYVNVGEYVVPQTRVASIYVFDPVRVSISVPEAAIGQVREGQTLDVRVSAWPDRTFPAKVEYLSPALRANTRDLVIEARAANADAALRPGMFATVELALGEETVPAVPQQAVVTDGTIKRLFLVKEGRAFELVVETGLTRDGFTAVHEKLEVNTAVVANPPPGLRDGAPLAVGDAPARVER